MDHQDIRSYNIRFRKNPTSENFLSILDVVKPHMLRGGLNSDIKGKIIPTDIIDIAMVKAVAQSKDINQCV